jgi:hypothetical protein
MRVAEPFGATVAQHHSLEEIAHDAGAELILDAFKWLDADGRTVRTGGGEAIQDVEGGYVRRLGFLAPTPMPWPMPLYELALMTARPRRDRRTAGGRLRPGDRLSGRRSDRARALPPIVHAVVLGGEKPLYLSARLTGGHGSCSEISETPPASGATKIAAQYLAPYLKSRDRAVLR